MCVFRSAALTERDAADFERFDLDNLDKVYDVTAASFEVARETARDNIAREIKKRGLRPVKSGRTEAVDVYQGTRLICEFYGFDEP